MPQRLHLVSVLVGEVELCALPRVRKYSSIICSGCLVDCGKLAYFRSTGSPNMRFCKESSFHSLADTLEMA